MKQASMQVAGKRTQLGSSLLEVLIAVLVLAIGMLGMAALEMVTLKNSNSAAARSQAVIQTYSAFDLMRLNRDVAIAGGYNVSDWTCTHMAKSDPDDESDYALFNAWIDGVQNSLGDPVACGRIACGANECTVGIRWNDSRATGGGEEMEVETSSRL